MQTNGINGNGVLTKNKFAFCLKMNVNRGIDQTADGCHKYCSNESSL